MTSVVNHLQFSRFLQLYDVVAAKAGIKLLIGFDFRDYVSIMRAIPTKSPIQPTFRPDRSAIKSGEGYWIIGLDKKKEIMLSDAARLYDLSESNFAEHLQSLKAFYADPIIHAHPEDRCTCIAPSAKKMSGKVAYNGELWVRKDFRGEGIAQAITRIAHSLSFAMWAPDFLCALVARWRVDKGGVPQYRHHEPGGAILQLVEEDIVEDDWLVWLTGQELRGQVERQHRIELILPS